MTVNAAPAAGDVMSGTPRTASSVHVQARDSGLLVVACVMKHSRQVDLCKQKLVSMQPQQGVMFCPLDPALTHGQPAFDALLVKATDFLDERLDAAGNLSATYHPALQQVILVLLLCLLVYGRCDVSTSQQPSLVLCSW
jgi:hypothetical protein